MNHAIEDDLIGRAIRAHSKRDGGAAQPNRQSSALEEINGSTFVVLRNVRGILSTYRVCKDGRLSYVDADGRPDGLTE